MKRHLLALVASVMLVGFVGAEEFTLLIGSINADGSVTGYKRVPYENKGPFKGKTGMTIEMATVKLARDVRVHKGKRDPKTEAFIADGDDLKLAGLKAALQKALDGNVNVRGTVLGEKDTITISMHDGKPVAKLNDKEIPFGTVNIRGKDLLTTLVTTSDDGVATTILLPPPGMGAFLPKKKADN